MGGWWSPNPSHPSASLHAGAVGSVLPYGPQVAEHCILGAQLQPGSKPAGAPLQLEEVGRLMASIQALEAWLQGCADAAPRGYIYSKTPGQPLALPLPCVGSASHRARSQARLERASVARSSR